MILISFIRFVGLERKRLHRHRLLVKFIVATFDFICIPHLSEDFISTWKMKLIKIGVGIVNLSREHEVYSQFVVNLSTLLPFLVLFHCLEPSKPLITKLQKWNQDIY